jgi:ABC-type multidrug transport system fused ATPase/permease subunit
LKIKLNQKIYSLLEAGQRKQIHSLFLMMLVVMAFEVVGLGILVPIISLMANGEAVQSSALLEYFRPNFLDNPNDQNLLLLGLCSLVTIFFVKTIFLAYFAWRQSHFISSMQASISRRLFSIYLNQPYDFHLQRNSSELIRNSLSHAGAFGGLLQQSLLFLTEIVVGLGLIVMLLIVEPLGAIVVGSILGFCGWLFNYTNRLRILKWGGELQFHEARRIQYLQEGIGAIKDVKLLGRERNFQQAYEVHNLGSAKISAKQSVLQALPRLWLELLAVLGIVGLVLVMLLQEKPKEFLLPTLGLFAAVAFRLMPSVNRILNAQQTLRFSIPMVDTLYNELIILGATPTLDGVNKFAFNHKISVDELYFSYDRKSKPIFNGINIAIGKGEIIGLIGGSGGGKSTLVDLILGLLLPDRGGVLVDGVNIKANIRGWQDNIGYVPQSIFLTDDTIRKNIAFGLSEDEIEDRLVFKAIESAQLSTFISQLPDGLDTIVGERGVRLSGGQRQRIGIARALYRQPQLLVLDEATSALDYVTESSVMDAILAMKGVVTIIVVAHRLSTVENCDVVYKIESGNLVVENSF